MLCNTTQQYIYNNSNNINDILLVVVKKSAPPLTNGLLGCLTVGYPLRSGEHILANVASHIISQDANQHNDDPHHKPPLPAHYCPAIYIQRRGRYQ